MPPTDPATAPPSAVDLLHRHAQAVNRVLQSLRPPPIAPARLAEAMAYSLDAGGKRLRPALVLETAFACGQETPSPAALAAAASVEMIHTFSLIHDDLPAMDDDDLRRGRPTNHKVFGEALAILAGDALSVGAFEVLATVDPAEVSRALVRELARATGPVGMVGGQVLDIEGEGKILSADELQRLHCFKTGALITGSVRMGAIAAGAGNQTVASLTDYGDAIGLAFQIADDILDCTATPEQMGKATGKDANSGKNTFPGLYGLDASRRMAAEQIDRALAAVAPMGQRSAGLAALARFVLDRKN